jgi:hypothetical protein
VRPALVRDFLSAVAILAMAIDVHDLKSELRLPHWEPYVDAVLAKKRAAESASDSVSASERKTGVKHAEGITARLVQDDRGWLWLAS